MTMSVLAVLAGTGFVCFLLRSGASGDAEVSGRTHGRIEAVGAIPVDSSLAARGLKKERGTNARQRLVTDRERECEELSSADRKMSETLQSALDAEDFGGVASQVKNAVSSKSAAVRLQAVEALQWFGDKALPELTLFMADADDDVRTTAIDAWTMAVSQMDAGKGKADTVLMGLSVVTDRDQLESMVSQVDDLTDFQKLDVLTRVIEGDNRVSAEVAREHYKFWTDEDYTNVEAAQKWLDQHAQE